LVLGNLHPPLLHARFSQHNVCVDEEKGNDENNYN
jgi:hypothetical protein